MEIFFGFWFVFVFGIVIFVFASNIKQWHKNNNSPRLTVNALIVAKRRATHHHRNGTTHSYHVTFQFESGDRLEMRVPRGEFGVLVEGDRGNLTLQGTRYISFERIY